MCVMLYHKFDDLDNASEDEYVQQMNERYAVTLNNKTWLQSCVWDKYSKTMRANGIGIGDRIDFDTYRTHNGGWVLEDVLANTEKSQFLSAVFKSERDAKDFIEYLKMIPGARMHAIDAIAYFDRNARRPAVPFFDYLAKHFDLADERMLDRLEEACVCVSEGQEEQWLWP